MKHYDDMNSHELLEAEGLTLMSGENLKHLDMLQLINGVNQMIVEHNEEHPRQYGCF